MFVNQGEAKVLQTAGDLLSKAWMCMPCEPDGANTERSDLYRIIKDLVWSAKELARNAKHVPNVTVSEPH